MTNPHPLPPIEVETLCLPPLDNNCYLVWRQGCGDAVVVDPASSAQTILAACAARGLRPVAVLLTHGHFDHIGAAAALQAAGARVYLHAADLPLLRLPIGRAAQPFRPDVLLSGGETLDLAGLALRVAATPGHSPGGVCYCTDSLCFSGDTLFYRSVGSTEFPGGEPRNLVRSLREVLYTLPADTRVCPGHGPETTIGAEALQNPYVRAR